MYIEVKIYLGHSLYNNFYKPLIEMQIFPDI